MNNKVQGIKNETIDVLKDFSTKEGLIENSKKMHHLRIFAMVFNVFTLLLSLVAAVFTILNGFSSGHDFEGIHYGATFNGGALAFALAALVLSFIYLRQAYRNKNHVWIPALILPVLTFVFLHYVSDVLSWYGIGADVAQGSANFAAILALPPIFLELTVTGHMQKVGNLIQNFFLSLKNDDIHILRIIAVATTLVLLLVKVIDLVYVGTAGPLFQNTLNFSIWFFIPFFVAVVLYIQMTRKHSNYAWICTVAFTLFSTAPGTIAMIQEYPLAENLSYTALALSVLAIFFEVLTKTITKKK